jgi:hypothetical protein
VWHYVDFEVLTAVTVKEYYFGNVMLFSLVEVQSSSEMSVNIYQTTQRHSTDDSTLHGIISQSTLIFVLTVSKHEENGLLWCDAMPFRERLTIQENMAPPSSGSKRKPSKKQVAG